MISLHKHVSLLRIALLLGCTAFCSAVFGQGVVSYPRAPRPAMPARHDIQLAITFEASGSNLDYAASATSFLYGGGVDVGVDLFRGFGAAASFTGLHTQNSGQGVPINLVSFTFGPSYTYRTSSLRHNVSLFGHALVGEMNGFDGLYPSPGGPITSANSLALQFGGGVDIGISRHLSVRALNADLLRSTLPDGTTNVQNNLRLGAGIVLHSTPQ